MPKPTTQEFSIKDVAQVAGLAKLSLSEEKMTTLYEQFRGILNLMRELGEVDTDQVSPTAQVTGLSNVFREDVVGESLSQEEALSQAPEHEQGHFKIAAVFADDPYEV